MNSYLFLLSIIDIICVVCIVVIYEIRLGRMKEVVRELLDEGGSKGHYRANAEYEKYKRHLYSKSYPPERKSFFHNGLKRKKEDRISKSSSIMEEAQKRG